MVLIIGGAYQGKLDYVLENHPGKSVYQCDTKITEIDFTSDIVNALHILILAQIRAGIDPLIYIKENLHKLDRKIVICDDISCGIVPVDPEMRQWREASGRCLTLLSKNADEVVRMFCGIGSRIK